MDPLKQLIEAKRQALQKAKADVVAIAEQVKALEAMMPTPYEVYLAQKNDNPVAQIHKTLQATGDLKIHPSASVEQQKNPKGSLTPVILNVLSDGIVRDMDDMLRDVNKRMNTPTTRDSLRSTLGILRKKQEIESPGYGKYSIPKSESPANSTATNSEGEAFKLQPSPEQGR